MIIFHRSFIIIMPAFFLQHATSVSLRLLLLLLLSHSLMSTHSLVCTLFIGEKKLNFIVMAFHSHNEIFSHRLSRMFAAAAAFFYTTPLG
jgi:hypothetical protein